MRGSFSSRQRYGEHGEDDMAPPSREPIPNHKYPYSIAFEQITRESSLQTPQELLSTILLRRSGLDFVNFFF